VLVMTATPIPRTLALTLYGDLDVSVLDELPPGRSPSPPTLICARGGRAASSQLIRETLARGEQVYVVYPLVEEIGGVDLRNVSESAARIARAFPEATVGLVHGRLDAAARADAMDRFERGETADPGRDHGDRGRRRRAERDADGDRARRALRPRAAPPAPRAGRPRRAAGTLCAGGAGRQARSEARLRAMLETADGFAIADADLRIRGPGEFLGTRQSGRLPDLRLADLVRDARLVPSRGRRRSRPCAATRA
jgi:ATP-dependent DNA helicase RecG